MEKIRAEVTMTGIYTYMAPAYGYGYEERYIYTMTADDGTVYVWKTGTNMSVIVPFEGNPKHANWYDRKGNPVEHLPVNKGDRLTITASVKGHDEYKGQPQTVLQRVKVIERTVCGKTWEEIQEEKRLEFEAKKAQQAASITDGDIVMRMPYKKYKEHYSDCETVLGSYDKENRSVQVIVRNGRLKNSGVRGEHYRYFWLRNAEGLEVAFKAIKEENAIKRAVKLYGGGEWECFKINYFGLNGYSYNRF